MQLGKRHRQAIRVGICVIAIAIGVVSALQRGDAKTPMSALHGASAVVEAGSGGSLAATVSWPTGAADRSDICVVLFDDDGGVVDELVDRLEPIPGRRLSGRWAVDGLPAGRYTVYVAQCVTPAATPRAWVEPQFLCGSDDAVGACWVEVTDGEQVDVGTITLHRSGMETWRTRH